MTLQEDDEVTVIARCDTGTGTLTFVNESNPSAQSDVINTTSTAGAVTTAVFVAKTSGTYRIADSSQKKVSLEYTENTQLILLFQEILISVMQLVFLAVTLTGIY
jgi:hypothetical protein